MSKSGYMSREQREFDRMMRNDADRQAKETQSAALENERQTQEYINMGLGIGSQLALTAPLGFASGAAVGIGMDRGLPVLLDSAMKDPVLNAINNTVTSIFRRTGKVVSQEDQDRVLAQRRALDAEASARDAAINAETQARVAAKKASKEAAFHPVYSQQNFQSANIGPISYVAPTVNAINAQKQQRMDTYLAQKQQQLEALKQQTLGVFGKQMGELASLQKSQKAYYTTLQSQASKQRAAMMTVNEIEATQQAQALQALQQAANLPTSTRRLPPTISLSGAIVGRGRRRR